MNRILIFEQDPKEAVRLSQFLQNVGFAVATVTTGRQALSFIREYDFDLYLVSLGAPGEYGLATVAELRRHDRTSRVKVLAVLSDDRFCSSAVEEGSDVTLVHPIDRDQLLQVITELLEDSRSSITYIEHPMENQPQDSPSTQDRDATFGSVMNTIVTEIDCLGAFLPELGDQGPLALESMEDAVRNLSRRLDLDTVIPGQDVPVSVHDRQMRHDFRNLLAAINGFSEILLLEEGLSEDLQERLQRIKKASRHFCNLLDNIKESAA